MASPKIVVVGSCNIDISTYVPYLPKPGETLHADKLVISHGGKGANQCVAATRLGASTALVGRLGNDLFGKKYLEDLNNNEVNTDFLNISEDTSTGTAVITVAENGENQIVIVSGANREVSPSDVKKAASVIEKADVVVFQLETPVETTVEALQIIHKGKGKSIVNAAPALAHLDEHVYKLADVFCVNETEAEIMTGVVVNSEAHAERAIRKLLEKGCRTVVLTMGVQGVVFATAENHKAVHIPAKVVMPVDTTGAGDAFIGAMAYFLAYLPDLPLHENLTRCCEIAAVTVQTLGAQTSFPRRAQLPGHLFK